MKRSCEATGIDTTGTTDYTTIDYLLFEALKAAATAAVVVVVVVSLNDWAMHKQ